MSDYPMLISNKLHSFRNFVLQCYYDFWNLTACYVGVFVCILFNFKLLFFVISKDTLDIRF